MRAFQKQEENCARDREVGFGAQIADEDLATNRAWRNDAEGYMIVGDPAVQLRVDTLESP